MKSHSKRSSLVAWILNYLYELTLTLNARNRNQKESGREQDSCRTKNQDFVALAPYHMPIEVVSVRVREHQHEERAPSGVVFGTGSGRDAVVIVRRNEKMKEFEAQWNQGRDELTNYLQVTANNENWVLNQVSWQERMIILPHSTIIQGDCHFVEEIVNFEQRIKNNQSQHSHRGTEKQRVQTQLMTNRRSSTKKQDSCTTRDQ